MPNTIAHFAINGLLTRTVIRHADFKWIYFACVIPDLPWIVQRVVKSLPLSVDLYDLRAYCIAQSSLLLCIFICIALAMFATQRLKVFTILLIGCLLHLLLDAVQIKWANGIQLFAPFDWHLLRFDLFWPESLGTYLLTAAGLLYLLFNLKKAIQPNDEEFVFNKISFGLGMLFLVAWLTLPFVFIQSVYAEDNHYISTLKDVKNRSGKEIEIDRNTYFKHEGQSIIRTSYGDKIMLQNIQAIDGDKISLQGKFLDNHTIKVDTFHIHTKFRDYASMLGLACVLLIWLIFFLRCLMKKFGRIE